MDSHIQQFHSGPELTKRLIRNKFWITGGKRAISTVINKCYHKQCVSKRAKPTIQAPPALPLERMGNDCYENISLDACGPFRIKLCGICNFSATCRKCNKKKSEDERKEEEEQQQCKTKKVWITLFACMASRHVNLEMVQDKSCECFLMAFQRHCSENGR